MTRNEPQNRRLGYARRLTDPDDAPAAPEHPVSFVRRPTEALLAAARHWTSGELTARAQLTEPPGGNGSCCPLPVVYGSSKTARIARKRTFAGRAVVNLSPDEGNISEFQRSEADKPSFRCPGHPSCVTVVAIAPEKQDDGSLRHPESWKCRIREQAAQCTRVYTWQTATPNRNGLIAHHRFCTALVKF
jgi:hypothetical protein